MGIEDQGEGTCDVAKNHQGGFKLKKRDYVELAFWKNGFQLDDGDLRAYDDPAGQAFMKSIADG